MAFNVFLLVVSLSLLIAGFLYVIVDIIKIKLGKQKFRDIEKLPKLSRTGLALVMLSMAVMVLLSFTYSG